MAVWGCRPFQKRLSSNVTRTDERRRTGTRGTSKGNSRHGHDYPPSFVSLNVLGKRSDDSLKVGGWIQDKPFFMTIDGVGVAVLCWMISRAVIASDDAEKVQVPAVLLIRPKND
jgi:hypothetical protein